MLTGIFQFIRSKTFLKHLFLYFISIGLLIWIIYTALGAYTIHDGIIKVPNFKGVKLNELDNFIADKKVRYLLIDSVYDAKAAKGTVIKQEPEPDSEVKEGRIVYLYITSVLPPFIQMPKLIDRSMRQATTMISTYGLKLGKIQYVSDECANCVLDQLIKGEKILPGTKIPKGSVINLIVGKGLGDDVIKIPCLFGLTRKVALEHLAEALLSIGTVKFDEPKDSLSAKVYRQSPSCNKQASIILGGTVDLFLSSDINKLKKMADTSYNNQQINEEDFDN